MNKRLSLHPYRLYLSIPKKVMVTLAYVLCLMMAFDIALLSSAKRDLNLSHDALYSAIESEKPMVANAIECAPLSDVEIDFARECLLAGMGRVQNPSSMLALALIAQSVLKMKPDDLQLRLGTIYALTKTVHAHRNMETEYQQALLWHKKLCAMSPFGWLTECGALVREVDKPSRIGTLLRIRYKLSRGNLALMLKR